MAGGRKRKEKVEKAVQFTKSQYTDYLTKSADYRSTGSRYSKLASEERSVFKERSGISADAIAFVDKLVKFDDQLKAQNVMAEVLMLVDLAGLNNQGNLFDYAAQRAERDIKKDTPEEEKDLRPAFLQNALPLDKAEKEFDAAKEVAEAKKAVAAKVRKSTGPALPH